MSSLVPHRDQAIALVANGASCGLVILATGEEVLVDRHTKLFFNEAGWAYIDILGGGAQWLAGPSGLLKINLFKNVAGRLYLQSADGHIKWRDKAEFEHTHRYGQIVLDVNAQLLKAKIYKLTIMLEGARLLWQIRDFQD